ncbi:hypothetical protein BIY27_11510 [Gibbsiella quercinecans]|uniref:hypothetical protein n=1 Tax=Gibbsiella quercinecans TaxID=929813 RepID=UPI000EF24AB7|nr:hypothetical protein [Gibbsiella quercinecans]RLM12581.1 hypothetical protein BIY27_11510 [Gibbsiella quercinecans]
MEAVEKQKQTLERIRLIAELVLIAQQNEHDMKLALGMITDLTNSVLSDQESDEIFYNAEGG